MYAYVLLPHTCQILALINKRVVIVMISNVILDVSYSKYLTTQIETRIYTSLQYIVMSGLMSPISRIVFSLTIQNWILHPVFFKQISQEQNIYNKGSQRFAQKHYYWRKKSCGLHINPAYADVPLLTKSVLILLNISHNNN